MSVGTRSTSVCVDKLVSSLTTRVFSRSIHPELGASLLDIPRPGRDTAPTGSENVVSRVWLWLRRQWLVIRVMSTFFAIIVLVFFFTDYEPLARHVNLGGWMAEFATRASSAILTVLAPLFGLTLSVSGTRIVFGGFAVDVTEACSGVVPTAIYWAAVLAYPAGWKARLIGLALGTAVIHSLNVLRVIALIFVGLFANAYFHYTHVYFAQALIIVVAVATWVFWASRFADATSS